MQTCQKCKSDRILLVNGKTSDLCFALFKGKEHEGYVPEKLNIGGGDYLEFSVCLECGQLQGKWPVKNDPKF